MNERATFYALQSFAAWPDRLYRVRVLPESILGGCVAGQFHSKRQTQAILDAGEISLYPLFRPLVLRSLKRRRRRQQAYRHLLPDERVYRAVDRRNFAIELRQIAAITLKKGCSFVRSPDSIATLKIQLASGRVRKLLIIGQQDSDHIAQLLRSVFPDLQVTGNAPQTIPFRRRLPSDAKNDHWISAATAFMVVSGGSVLAIFVAEPKWPMAATLLAVAAVCGVAAYVCIRRWRRNEAQKDASKTVRK